MNDATLPVKRGLQVASGGIDLALDEVLLRFVGHSRELDSLLTGGFSLTRASRFSDPLEARSTQADKHQARTFFGELGEQWLARDVETSKRILHRSFVSCWHRLAKDSDLVDVSYIRNPTHGLSRIRVQACRPVRS